MDLALSAYGEISEADARHQNALAMVQSVEEEVRRATDAGKKQANELTAIISELAGSVEALRKGVDLVERGSNASRGRHTVGCGGCGRNARQQPRGRPAGG